MSNMQNPNKGTADTNRQYDQNQGTAANSLTQIKKGSNFSICSNKFRDYYVYHLFIA